MGKKVRKATVLSTKQITPHLQRIIVGSDEFNDLSAQYIGNYVKVLIPQNGRVDFNIKTTCMRSYTIRHVDEHTGALTLDFVIQGPATNWAKEAKVGDEVGIAGPGPKKLDNYDHSYYLLLGDLTSVNAIKGYVQQLPINAKIDAIIHAPTKDDVISLDSSRDVTWLITNNPDTDMIKALKSLPLSEQQPIVFMALEAGLVRKAKTVLTDELAIPRSQIVASGYWKKGLDSEAYKLKRQHAAAKNS
jgi:NADPH-dependent ferric siderophore reductase